MTALAQAPIHLSDILVQWRLAKHVDVKRPFHAHWTGLCGVENAPDLKKGQRFVRTHLEVSPTQVRIHVKVMCVSGPNWEARIVWQWSEPVSPEQDILGDLEEATENGVTVALETLWAEIVYQTQNMTAPRLSPWRC